MTSPAQEPHYEHFRSMPWCAKLMADPAFELRPTNSRMSKASTEDDFFAQTLNTDKTISAAITYGSKLESEQDAKVSEAWSLLSIGSGLNGHPGMCHGGVVTCMFDEVMGILVGLNQQLDVPKIDRMPTSTAYLNTTYLRHVKTPQTVLVRARLNKSEGRKHFFDAVMTDEHGEALAKAEALFVTLKARF